MSNTLDEMNVQIHFKENGIPSIHAGKLTDESKAKIQALITEEYRKGYTEGVIDNSINKDRLITEARIDELEKLDRTVEYIHQDTITDRLKQLKENN